jgi:hypothetical protein
MFLGSLENQAVKLLSTGCVLQTAGQDSPNSPEGARQKGDPKKALVSDQTLLSNWGSSCHVRFLNVPAESVA